jgi:integrase
MDDLIQDARQAILPAKSGPLYERYLREFMGWLEEHARNINDIDSDIMAAYIKIVLDKYKATSASSRLSAIKTGLLTQGINIKPHLDLAYKILSKKSKEQKTKKAKVISKENLDRYWLSLDVTKLSELQLKAATQLMFLGFMRHSECCALLKSDLEFTHDKVIVTIRQSKTDQSGQSFSFHLTKNPNPLLCPVNTVSQLLDKMEKKENSRLFLQVRNGKMTGQPHGKTWFSNLAKEAAVSLGLSDPESYTGHTYRRSAATAAAERGISQQRLQEAGRWSHEKTARSYVETSSRGKEATSNLLQDVPSQDVSSSSNVPPAMDPTNPLTSTTIYQNCSFVVHNYSKQD